jgi:hypothetical protein
MALSRLRLDSVHETISDDRLISPPSNSTIITALDVPLGSVDGEVVTIIFQRAGANVQQNVLSAGHYDHRDFPSQAMETLDRYISTDRNHPEYLPEIKITFELR